MVADVELRTAGFTVFAPTAWFPGRGARRDGRILRPARPAHTELLFARYLFVRFARVEPWQAIHHLPGVECLLGVAHDTPTPMTDSAIATIRATCLENGCRYPAGTVLDDLEAFVPIAPGVEVRFVSGPMVDRRGVCLWSDAGRIELLMQMLGREIRVPAPRAMVEAV